MCATITNEMKRIYLMKNINEKMFDLVLTSEAFLDKYDMLKAYIMNEYSLQMTQEVCARIIYNAIDTTKRKANMTLDENKREAEKKIKEKKKQRKKKRRQQK